MKIETRKIISSIRDTNILGTGKFSKILAKIFLPKPTGPVVVKTIYDFKLKVDPVQDTGVERAIYNFGVHERGTLNIISKTLKPGDIFVDVGANIGLMSILASQTVGDSGKVIAFEPNPVTRKILDENIVINEVKNITVEPFALSSESKHSKIYDRWDVNRGGASLIKPENPTASYDIEEITFSDYFQSFDKISMVKIDVEGFELEVLKGSKSFLQQTAEPPIIIVEFSSKRENTFGKSTVPIFDFLKSLDLYTFYKHTIRSEITSKLKEIKNEHDLPLHDNVYCLTERHLNLLKAQHLLEE